MMARINHVIRSLHCARTTGYDKDNLLEFCVNIAALSAFLLVIAGCQAISISGEGISDTLEEDSPISPKDSHKNEKNEDVVKLGPPRVRKGKVRGYLLSGRWGFGEPRIAFLDLDGKEVWTRPWIHNWQQQVHLLGNDNLLIADVSRSSVRQGMTVAEVTPAGKVVWSLRQTDHGQVYAARRLENGNTLIASRDRRRVQEVDASGAQVWGMAPSHARAVPSDAWRLSNGNTLVAERGAHRVVEYDSQGAQIRTFGGGHWLKHLSSPASLDVTSSGEILIATSWGLQRFSSQGTRLPSVPIPLAQLGGSTTSGERLPDGTFLIAALGHPVKIVTASGKVLQRLTKSTFYGRAEAVYGETVYLDGNPPEQDAHFAETQAQDEPPDRAQQSAREVAAAFVSALSRRDSRQIHRYLLDSFLDLSTLENPESSVIRGRRRIEKRLLQSMPPHSLLIWHLTQGAEQIPFGDWQPQGLSPNDATKLKDVITKLGGVKKNDVVVQLTRSISAVTFDRFIHAKYILPLVLRESERGHWKVIAWLPRLSRRLHNKK